MPLARPTRPGAFTLVELLVVIAIVGLLVALMLPAVQAARESARATQCKNHLKQIGLATIMFHDANEAFPPARLARQWSYGDVCDNVETSWPSWFARILPYLEESVVGDQWSFYDYVEEQPEELRLFAPSVYTCPSRRTAEQAVIREVDGEREVTYPCGCLGVENVTLVGGAVGDYAGNHGDVSRPWYGKEAFFAGGNGTGVIISSRCKCDGAKPTDWIDRIGLQDVTDGASKTILAGEMYIPPNRIADTPHNGPLYNGQDLPAFGRFGGAGAPMARSPLDPTFDPYTALSFGSWHPGYCPFVWADGSVRNVEVQVDLFEYGNMMNRADGGDRLGPGDGAVPL